MDVRRMRNEALGKRVVKALESRNMEAYYASTKEEAVQKCAGADGGGKLGYNGRLDVGSGIGTS